MVEFSVHICLHLLDFLWCMYMNTSFFLSLPLSPSVPLFFLSLPPLSFPLFRCFGILMALGQDLPRNKLHLLDNAVRPHSFSLILSLSLSLSLSLPPSLPPFSLSLPLSPSLPPLSLSSSLPPLSLSSN